MIPMVRAKTNRPTESGLGVSVMRKSTILTLTACLGLSCLGSLGVAAQTALPSVRRIASVLPATPPTNQAEAHAWSDPQPRDYLMKKAAAFLEGGAGSYIVTNRYNPLSTVPQRKPGSDHPGLPEQFNYVFGGVPDPEVTLVGSYRLFEACQVHNCGTKAVLVTDASGTLVQAAGLLKQFGCTTPSNALSQPTTQSGSQANACEDIPTLTIFYQSAQTKNAALTEQIIEWAKVKVADFFNTARLPDKGGKLKVEIKFVHGS